MDALAVSPQGRTRSTEEIEVRPETPKHPPNSMTQPNFNPLAQDPN